MSAYRVALHGHAETFLHCVFAQKALVCPWDFLFQPWSLWAMSSRATHPALLGPRLQLLSIGFFEQAPTMLLHEALMAGASTTTKLSFDPRTSSLIGVAELKL